MVCVRRKEKDYKKISFYACKHNLLLVIFLRKAPVFVFIFDEKGLIM